MPQSQPPLLSPLLSPLPPNTIAITTTTLSPSTTKHPTATSLVSKHDSIFRYIYILVIYIYIYIYIDMYSRNSHVCTLYVSVSTYNSHTCTHGNVIYAREEKRNGTSKDSSGTQEKNCVKSEMKLLSNCRNITFPFLSLCLSHSLSLSLSLSRCLR